MKTMRSWRIANPRRIRSLGGWARFHAAFSPQIERAKSLPTTPPIFRRTKTIGVKNEKPKAAQNGYILKSVVAAFQQA
jgi:hypothetical protein